MKNLKSKERVSGVKRSTTAKQLKGEGREKEEGGRGGGGKEG